LYGAGKRRSAAENAENNPQIFKVVSYPLEKAGKATVTFYHRVSR